MNEKQIQEAANNYFLQNTGKQLVPIESYKAFQEGAKWALAQDILSSNTEINENEIVKTSKLSYEEMIKEISEVITNFSLDGGYTFEYTHRDDIDTYAYIAKFYASKVVQQRDEEIKEWIKKEDAKLEFAGIVRISELLKFIEQ